MKAINKIYLLVLFFSFLSQIYSSALYNYYILHENSELPKVCPAEDENVLALSTIVGEQKFMQTKLDKDAKPIYSDYSYGYGYTGSAQLLSLKKNNTCSNYFLFYHNKQDLSGHDSKENLFTFSDQDKEPYVQERIKRIYPSKSGVTLKNGKILIAGINTTSSKYAETTAGVEIYDPFTKEYGNGLSFSAHSSFISCYEQIKNHIYCVYVSYEDAFVTQLRIKHILYNEYGSVDTLSIKADKVIKNFYTEFNYLKAVAFNETEAVVLFQTGNSESEPELGNSGQDLYYYHLQVNDTVVVKVKRYELLFNKCKYVKDPEDYNADISVLSPKRIYAVCQFNDEDDKFYGFMITPGVKKIQKFKFPNNDNSKDIIEVKNPVFAKFNKTLALFYSLKTKNGNRKTAYFLLNYPDCNDSKTTYKIPKHHSKEINILPLVFMSNPYPANRAIEEIFLRISDNSGISIFDESKNEKILNNFDYKGELNLKLVPESLEGEYDIEFTATRNDELDGLILGRTCKIHINTPICLPQCYSCTKKGTEDHHNCLGCADGSYYEEEDETAVNEGYGKPHNCRNCDISCRTCYGKYLFLSSAKPNQTTNCIKCNYTHGYYHYEYDNRTCISKKNQSEWEKILEHPIYLDKTPADKPEQWRWRHCHKNCASCSGPGTDEDNQCDSCKENEGLFFYCNQTKGHGIPGSCHNDCLNNGYYLHEDEEDKMNKCCPCLKDCKVCKNETKCEDCFPTFYKTPEWDKCNKTCNSCLAYDDDLRECVFCRDRYNKTDIFPRYNYKQKCYDKSILEEFHLIDDVCYNVTKCDVSCFTCSPENTSLCTQCSPDYYREDFFGLTPNKTFRCFSKRQCQGVEDYPPEKDYKVGGVPIEENGELVCLNCRLRNNSYRQPEDNFYCGEKIPKTFVDIENWHKLTKCYTRCKTCDSWGNACFMNCKSCLDKSNYDLILYDIKNQLGNCYRKAHKCGIYPYYHDYDIAPALGYDEDNCGEKCDVCLYNFTCPDSFPYFNFETHECVEFCPLTRVMGNQCSLNNSNALAILLRNPFGLRDPYDFLYRPGVINRLMKTELLKYFASSYNIDLNVLEKSINNYLESGTIFNLPNSQVIVGNNISITLSSTRLEKEKNESIVDNGPPINESIIDISACEALLKKKYGIPEEEELIVVKGDTFKKLSESYLGNSVDYQLFSVSLGCFLPLSDCEAADTPVIVTNPFSTQELVTELQNKIGAIVSNGYDPFNSESPFYNDICTPFTNENGNDVLLNERRTDYFNENINICDKDCTFSHYDPKTKMYTCKCKIQIVGKESGENGTKSEDKYVEKALPESFYKRQKNSNIEVIKCSSQVFSSSGQKKNFGSYCLITCFAGFLVTVVFYFVKGKESLNLIFSSLSNFSANPPKPQNKEKSKPKKEKTEKIKNPEKENYDDLMSKREKPKNPEKVQKDLVLNDIELNGADYEIACKKDYRNYGQMYWSLLKNKQLFIFTFYTSNDHNLRVVKIALFILFISFYFAFTALFFNDNIMREIYTYKGNTNAAVHVPNIILSSFCCIIMNFIVRFVSLSERDISKITQEKNPDQRKALAEKTRRALKIKLIILFAISGLLIGLCWYYVSAFCAVFKNSQGHYFTNLLIAFVVCNIWPCVTSLIPPIFRKKSLDDATSPCMYKFSQIIAYI